MADWSRRRELFVLIVLLAVLGGAAVLLGWFVETVLSR